MAANDQNAFARCHLNAPIRHELSQHCIHPCLPPGPAAAQVFDCLGIQPDFHLDLRVVELGPAPPRWLQSRQEGGVHRRIVVIELDLHSFDVHPFKERVNDGVATG